MGSGILKRVELIHLPCIQLDHLRSFSGCQLSEKKQFKGGRACFGLEVEGTVHHAGEGTPAGSTMMAGHGVVISSLLQEQEAEISQEMGPDFKTSRSAPSDPLHSVRLHLRKVPQPSEIKSPEGDHEFVGNVLIQPITCRVGLIQQTRKEAAEELN